MASFCVCLNPCPANFCFDMYNGGSVTGTPIFPCPCVPVLGLPGSPCPGSAPNLDNLPLTNPNTTYGCGTTEPITSPCSSGAVDMPPCPSKTWACPTTKGAGSGAGTAASAGAGTVGALTRPSCKKYCNTGGLLSKWGTALATLFGGPASYSNPSGGYIAPRTNNASIAPTSFGFLLVALIVGFILYQLAFSKN
jgi:hypothetical protein